MLLAVLYFVCMGGLMLFTLMAIYIDDPDS